MRVIVIFLSCTFIIGGCKNAVSDLPQDIQNRQRADLIKELSDMVIIDQLAAMNAHPPSEYDYMSQDEWQIFKDSIYRSHKVRLEKIIVEVGYPGYDVVGKNGESNFWVMVQHCDFDPAFQQSVLGRLEVEVSGKNASPRHYGLLTDRLRLNTGKKQLYGTQVTYNLEIAQAYPLPTEDSLNLNERRLELGFSTIESYLNEMSQMHFEMNKEHYLIKGVTGPALYPEVLSEIDP